jgi:hypothetical protein
MTTTAATATETVMTSTKGSEVEFARCESCGLTEECTEAYIERVRERFEGKWICGLCGEAVKDEMLRCVSGTIQEALTRHIQFRRSLDPPSDPTVHLISAMRQILRKTFDSPRLLRSMPTTPIKNTARIVPALILPETCLLSSATQIE